MSTYTKEQCIEFLKEYKQFKKKQSHVLKIQLQEDT